MGKMKTHERILKWFKQMAIEYKLGENVINDYKTFVRADSESFTIVNSPTSAA